MQDEMNSFVLPLPIIGLEVRKEIEIVASATTFVNAFYILRKVYDKDSLYKSMQQLSKICNISPVDREVIDKALVKEWKDFEDCVQSCSATAENADIIITCNTRDFTESSVAVLSPIDFLNQYFDN